MENDLSRSLETITYEYLCRWRVEAVYVRDRLGNDDPRRDDYDYTIDAIGRELSRREGMVA